MSLGFLLSRGENFTTMLFYVFVVLAEVSGVMVIRAKIPVHFVVFLPSDFQHNLIVSVLGFIMCIQHRLINKCI